MLDWRKYIFDEESHLLWGTVCLYHYAKMKGMSVKDIETIYAFELFKEQHGEDPFVFSESD